MKNTLVISTDSEFAGLKNDWVNIFFNRTLYFLITIDLLLGLAHLLIPEYIWGQGRSSYFNLENRLTLASWFVSIQVFGAAFLFFTAFQKRNKISVLEYKNILWIVGSILLAILSFSEITNVVDRLQLFGFPKPDIYEHMFLTFFKIVLLVTFGSFLINYLKKKPSYKKYVWYWLSAWTTSMIFNLLNALPVIQTIGANNSVAFISGTSYLLGCTFLLAAVSAIIFLPEELSDPNPTIFELCSVNPFPSELRSFWYFIGIGGMTFTIIFIQILLFRMSSIYADYLTANSIISTALVGISIGGLIGWRTAKSFPMHSIVYASLMLPLIIILSLAAVVKFSSLPVITSTFLMLPFVAASVVITVLLIRTKSHLVYAVDLIGAATGAILISPALSIFREEGSIIVLSALSLIFAGCFIYYLPLSNLRKNLFSLIGVGAIILFTISVFNQDYNWLNIVHSKVEKKYPKIEFLYSQSSFIGRYDVVLTYPEASTFKTLENGRTIDNIRSKPIEEYKIDPRIPYTYMENPKILIIGLSGDGITKTAKAVSNDITGIEINPVIASLQQNELVKLNNNSYEGIDVYVMDGKSFVAQSKEKFDMITLMNAHSVRGSIKGKSAGLEYLHTLEAFEDYIDHLTDKGIINIEEPIHKPEQEPAVWKLIATMKQALINKGMENPADHFFVFQWRTKSNNYMQILMKKTPFDQKDLVNLKKWLDDVDKIKELEAIVGKRLGPIRTVTTILYSPREDYQTNYARILNNQVDESFIKSKNLNISTDDRPFLFSIDPNYSKVKTTYINTFVISLLILPFLLSFLFKHRNKLQNSFPFALIVMLTGLGYLLVEVVLIQRYQLFLGSPIESFATVLSSLLIFSGLGSLWSGNVSRKKLFVSIFLNDNIALPLFIKIILTVLTIAPLAFFMGVIFPYILRKSKSVITDTAAGMFFAINAAASAMAAPLAISISTSYGFKATFGTGILIYLAILALIFSLNKKVLQKFVGGAVTILFIGLLLFPLTTGNAYDSEVDGKYELFGISYGNSKFRKDKVFLNESKNKKVSFEWIFWLAKGNDKTILIDTGFDDEILAKKWKIKNYTAPQNKLKLLGLSPDDITDVILTHAHWDHLGSLSSYKKATVWIQQIEYDHLQKLFLEKKSGKSGVRFEDLTVLETLNKEGRLKLINDDSEIFEGFALTAGGSHTKGSQYVTVETIDGAVIIAGDNAYMYENIRRHKPIGSSVDYDENLSVIRDMHKKAASPFFILPGHDPKVLRWFPEIADGIVHITTTERY
jgi:glyoxylase-like metal-dependent hydrolase (beta-lactamase superfamily II)